MPGPFKDDGSYDTAKVVPQIANRIHAVYTADVDGDGNVSPGEERWILQVTEMPIVDGMAREIVVIDEKFTSQEAMNKRLFDYLNG